MNLRLLSLLLIAAAAQLTAQTQTQPQPQPLQVWIMQDSGTTAGLRGIDSVDGTVAWASGTGGTVLRTIDGGANWLKCAVPDGDKDGATLDFRGVQAWDANTAIVMASGPSDKSRLYKTTDGCKTWRIVLRNPEKEGFWDALYFEKTNKNGRGRWDWGWLLGDPVDGMFWLLETRDAGQHWSKQRNAGLRVKPGAQSAFAASNSALSAIVGDPAFGIGGGNGAFIFVRLGRVICVDDCSEADMDREGRLSDWLRIPVEIGSRSESSGVFSINARPIHAELPHSNYAVIAVGGDYSKPNDSTGTAAWSSDGAEHWAASTTPPHGYRSTVQWSESLKLWITAGTNGSDISRDDGRTWQPLDNGNWNALSLPFIVGPSGRIARLNPAALPPARH
jgi:hypothetical protein